MTTETADCAKEELHTPSPGEKKEGFFPFRSADEMRDWEAKLRAGVLAECKSSGKRPLVDYLLIVVISVFCVFASLLSYQRYFALRIYTMNLAPVVDAKIRQVQARPGIEAEAAQKEVFEYMDALKVSADKVAKKKRGIVVLNQAVISGAIDVTEEVKIDAEKQP